MLNKKALAGTAGAPKLYVEDVFSTYLYTGNGSTQTITNEIDLSGKGGLVWIKQRDGTANHMLTDTARGTDFQLVSNSDVAQFNVTTRVTAFNTTGFNLGLSSAVNGSPNTYASWTFRKAEKFFDVVTYTGTGSVRTVAHNLGSVPGCIIIKATNDITFWATYHTSLGNTKAIEINTTNAAYTSSAPWNNTSPTSTQFTVGTSTDTNSSGITYVAYLFAHNAGGFGTAGTDNVISCGSFTANGSGDATVTLGYEPQWLLYKKTNAAGSWYIADNMRNGLLATGASSYKALYPNLSNAESGSYAIVPTATGFQMVGGDPDTFIYIAIRRGPMKTPTTGTSVFQPTTYAGDSTFPRTLNTTITPDLSISRARFSTNTNPHNNFFVDRLRGGAPTLASTLTAAEDSSNGFFFDVQNGVRFVSVTSAKHNNSVDDYINLSFKRAPGFFDVVCYTGTGSARTVSHNLGVAPELIIVKNRSSARDWVVYNSTLSATQGFYLNQPDAAATSSTFWNNTSPTSSVFTVDTNASVNGNGNNLVAYLFASVSGVSKIGTYTGNGSSVTVTTNFQPRFILVKRTDSTGDWIVSDSARGLVAGNDPFLKLNSTAAEVTNEDWVDITSTSFTVNQTTNNANVNTGTYIYLAIA